MLPLYLRAAVALLVAAAGTAVLATPGQAAIARTLTAARPSVTSLEAVPAGGMPLKSSGSRVVLIARVRNGRLCTFLAQRIPFSSLYPVKTVACASGIATATVAGIANPYKSQVRLSYAVRVRGAGLRTAQRTLRLSEQGATAATSSSVPAPTTTTTTTSPPSPTAQLSLSATTVPSSGGVVVLTFSSTNATSCTLESLPALWTGANPAQVDCNGSYSATISLTTAQQQWTFTFTATSSAGQSISSSQTLTQDAPAAPTFIPSQNWSGYVVPSSSLITDAAGEWTVPTLNCAETPTAGVGVWVGIGGVQNSETLLQTGITAQCVGGEQQTAAFWEEYPSEPNASRLFLGFQVSPGDRIQATVFQTTTGAWATRVDDLSTGLSGIMVTGEGWGVMLDAGNGTFSVQGLTAGLTYAGGSTAEWIAEDFGQNGSQITLADYGTVTFSDLGTSLSSWELTPSEGVEIVQNGAVLSTPSAPANDGFSVSYTG